MSRLVNTPEEVIKILRSISHGQWPKERDYELRHQWVRNQLVSCIKHPLLLPKTAEEIKDIYFQLLNSIHNENISAGIDSARLNVRTFLKSCLIDGDLILEQELIYKKNSLKEKMNKEFKTT